MIQPFIWRSKSPSGHCLAPAPCTSSPSKHEGHRELSSTTAKGLTYQGRAGGGSLLVYRGLLTWAKCLDLGDVKQSKLTVNGNTLQIKKGINGINSRSDGHTHLYKQADRLDKRYDLRPMFGENYPQCACGVCYFSKSQKHCTKHLYEWEWA